MKRCPETKNPVISKAYHIFGKGGMMNYLPAPKHRVLVFVLLTCCSILIFNSSLSSQILPNYGRPSPVERDMRFRDWALERLKKQKALTQKEQKLAYEQLNKDFTQLQILNNDLIQLRATEGVLDYHLISQKTLEIHKIATRLSEMLKLPELEDSEKKPSSTNAEINLSAVLMILDTVIYQFVKNPMFKNVEVIDIKDATNAKANLDRILLLSERAQKKAESLSKKD